MQVGLVVLAVVAAGLVPFVGPASATRTTAADVVIVFDRTVGMDAERDTFRERIANLTADLAAEDVDIRYAVVAYEGNDPGDTELIQGFTRDADRLREAFEFELFGTTENASHGIRLATGLDYREDARRVVVVVTDEDDDGTITARTAAREALEETNTTLVAVSPERRQPNDLRRLAESVDGRWVDIDRGDFEDVLEETFTVLDQVVRGYAPPDQPAEFTLDTTLNRTEVEIEEPVALTVDIKNVGGRNGSFIYLLHIDGDLVNQSQGGIRIRPGDTVTISETLIFDQRGGYNVEVSNRLVGRVVVTALRETNATVGLRDTGAGGDRLALSIRDLRADETVTLELPALQTGREGGVVFDELRVGANGVVRNLTADVRQTATRPPNVPREPDDIRPALTWLHVDPTGTERVENVTFGLRVREARLEGLPPENLAVYRHAGGGGWTRLATTYTGEAGDDYRYEVTSPGFSTFAVGARDGTFEVVSTNLSDRSVGVDEPVTVTAVVENVGEVDGDYRAILRANGEFVNDTVVRVPAGETRNVSFTAAFDAAGEYRLRVGDRGAGRLTVVAPATSTATPTPEPTPTDPAPDPATPTATPTAGEETPEPTASDGQSGFGPAVALLALLVGALLATRRRD